MPPIPIPSCILFLNGLPKIGKQALAARLHHAPELVGPTLVIDSHHITHLTRRLADTVIQDVSTVNAYYRHFTLCQQLREAVLFSPLKARLAEQPDLTVVVTGCLLDIPEHMETLTLYGELASELGVPFYLVNLRRAWADHVDAFARPEVLEQLLGGPGLCDERTVAPALRKAARMRTFTVNLSFKNAKEGVDEVLRVVMTDE